MPRMTSNLTPESSTMAVREAINKTIEELIKSGYDQKQAAAIAYEEAKKMTGKSLGREV